MKNTGAGVAITPESAMRVPAVNAAVSLISTTLGTLPPKLYRRVDSHKEIADDHPAHGLIHRRANSWTSAGKLRAQLTLDALLHGNGYAVANRTSEGRVAEFFHVPPTAMSVEIDAYGEPTYKLSQTGGVRRLSYRDVLHIPALTSFDGIAGRAPITLAREAIALALVMEEHGSKLFKDGARPSTVISYPAEASKADGQDKTGNTARRKLIEAARAGMAGVDNSGKLAIIFDGATVTPFAFSSVDAQFLELRRFAIDEIARAFRVPPTMLFELGRGTWGNTEQMGAQFVSYTLLPWIEAWTDAYSRVLFDENDDDLSIEFVVDDLLRADTATRFEAYSKAIASRVLNPNEVRALENRPPYEGGEHFVNPNTTTAATVPAKEAA
ncbi:phage portal protein [Aureimonas psammosilenae]|uniref:phage portal protein n=1 Tax=Aureimonas psammosilenae TaxID=2495496 RepID=UPI0022A6FEF9|nr:phage portal protein [Aureimonas psammosilenae]